MKAALCIAGFGDNDSMFEPLMETDLARHLKLLPIDLPGFGEPSLSVTSLDTLADVINERRMALHLIVSGYIRWGARTHYRLHL